MKVYQKAEIIAKNLPTGSYAAGCPTGSRDQSGSVKWPDGTWHKGGGACEGCEIAQ